MRVLYLNVAIECSVMQGRATGSVRDVDIGEERDEVLGTFDAVVGCRNVQRRLPVLVSCVDVGPVT